jgi:LppX_LprAFG lipoprotein
VQTRVVAGLALATALAATGAAGRAGAGPSPGSLLREAKATLDSTHAVHFELSSKNVSGSGTNLSGGSGDAVRPDGLRGSFSVTVDGLGASVEVAAKGAVFEVKLPFATHYTRTSPAALGLGNPSQLLNPKTGLSAVLTSGTGTRLSGTERIAGELLDEVTTEVPGSSVPILPSAAPSRPVTLVAAIDPQDHQLRQVTLTGYFLRTTAETTYVLRLTRYGESVSIVLPPAR